MSEKKDPTPEPSRAAPSSPQIKPNNRVAPQGQNTTGIILPKTDPNGQAVGLSTTAPTNPDAKEKPWYKQIWDGYKKRAEESVYDDLGETPPKSLERKGWEHVGSGIFGAVEDAAENGGGRMRTGAGPRKLAIPKAPVPKPAPKPSTPPTANKPPAEAPKQPAPKPAEKKKAATGTGKEGGHSKKQKPHADCGKLAKYRRQPRKNGLEKDHTPSGKALEKATIEKLKASGQLDKLSDKKLASIISSVKNNAPTIAIPPDVHAEGNTYKSKNNDARSTADSKDLSGAAKRDTEAIQKSMDSKDHGCSDAYKKAAAELQKFDFDKFIQDTIDKKLKPKPKK